jgi:hypothetical protein
MMFSFYCARTGDRAIRACITGDIRPPSLNKKSCRSTEDDAGRKQTLSAADPNIAKLNIRRHI